MRSHRNPGVGDWLILEANGDPGATPPMVRVYTQTSMTGAGRPDMLVIYHDRTGRVRRIVSEHKITAPMTTYQRDAYAQWKPDRLILISPSPDDYVGQFDRHFTWDEIASAARQIGGQHGDERWRDSAFLPDALSRQRCLAEFLLSLERTEVVRREMYPIQSSTVSAFSEARGAVPAIQGFLHALHDHPTLAPLQPSIIHESEYLSSDAAHWLKRQHWAAGAVSCLDDHRPHQ